MKVSLVHIPKTGGTSIYAALKEYSLENEWLQPDRAHRKASNTVGDYRFSIVRNPYDRLVSAYFHRIKMMKKFSKRKNPLPFDKFVLSKRFTKHNVLFHAQSYWLDEKIDHIGKFETLNKEWKQICHDTGIDIKLPHVNKGDHNDWRSYYNDELAEIVYDYYKEDFERFGYEKDSFKLNIHIKSFPRSGNTFFRIILNDVFGYSSWSRYGREFDDTIVTQEKQSLFVKHHKNIKSNRRSIIIVRDPRDAFLSFGSYKGKRKICDFEKWYWDNHKHLTKWWNDFGRIGNDIIIRYEDITKNPISAVRSALINLGLNCETKGNLRSFNELHEKNPNFFRRGISYGYLNDPRMSQQIHDDIVQLCDIEQYGYTIRPLEEPITEKSQPKPILMSKTKESLINKKLASFKDFVNEEL